MTTRVIAFPGVTLEPDELSPRERALREPPGSFCGIALGPDEFRCERCRARMHAECY